MSPLGRKLAGPLAPPTAGCGVDRGQRGFGGSCRPPAREAAGRGSSTAFVRLTAGAMRLLLYDGSPVEGTITAGSQRSREGDIVRSTMEGARVRRNRTRAVITTAAALSATAALAVPAGAAPPPPPGHTLISFTQRDFVSDQGFSLSDGPVIVNVIRNGAIIATSTPVTPADDPKTTGVFDGLVEVNHPGGGCWVTSTPDILPGDTIRMTTKSGTGFSEDTTTAYVTAEPAELGAGSTVVVHGTAQAAAGGPLPIDQIEQRIVANKQAFDANGRRTLRATSAGVDGTLRYDAPGSTSWTATYTGLSVHDVDMAANPALNNETRILWLGADPVAATEQTIFETAPDPVAAAFVPGPSAPCTAPAATTTILAMSRSVVNV